MAEHPPITTDTINTAVKNGEYTIRQGNTLKRWLAQEVIHDRVEQSGLLWGTVQTIGDHYEETAKGIINHALAAAKAANTTPMSAENAALAKKDATAVSVVAAGKDATPMKQAGRTLGHMGLALWNGLFLDPRMAAGSVMGRIHGNTIYNLSKSMGFSEQASQYARIITDVSTNVLFSGKAVGDVESLAAQGMKSAFTKTKNYLTAPLPESLKAAEEAAAAKITAQFESVLSPENLMGKGMLDSKTLYHGTPNAFNEFNPSRMEPGLYGKGVYLTDNPKVASGYSGMADRQGIVDQIAEFKGKTLNDYGGDAVAFNRDQARVISAEAELKALDSIQPNVHAVYADVKKTFDINKKYTEAEFNRIAKDAGIKPDAGPTSGKQISGQDIYDYLESFGKGKGAEGLQKAGYDSLTHTGGQITGGSPHQVTMVFDPKKVVSKFDPSRIEQVASQFLSDPKDIKELVAQFPERISAQAAGNVGTRATHGLTEARAAEIGPVTDAWIQKLEPGSILKAEQVVGMDRNGVQHLLDTWKKADEFLADPAGQSEAFFHELSTFYQSVEKGQAAAVVAGRAGEATKLVPGNKFLDLAHNIVYELGHEDSFLNGDNITALTEFAKKLKDLREPGNMAKVLLTNKELRMLPTRMDQLRAIYNNVLLTGIPPLRQATAVKKFIGDVYGQTKEIAERGAASYYAGDPMKLNDGLLYARGLMSSYGHLGAYQSTAVRSAASAALKKGLEESGGFFDYAGRRFSWDFAGKEFGAITDFMQKHAGLASSYVDSYKAADALLKSGAIKARDFAATVMEGVTNPSEGAIERMVETSLNTTFSHPVGAIGNLLKQAQKGIGWLLVPFAKIPANLANDYFSKVPGLNLLSRGTFNALADGPSPAYYRALAANSLGLWMLQFGYSAQKAGLATGSGPIDPKLRERWLAVNTPNAMKIGNQQIPTNWFYPVGPLIQTGASFAYFTDYFGDDDIMHAASAISIAVAKEVSDMPFLEILKGAVNVAEQLGRGQVTEAAQELGRVAVSPFEGIVGIVPGMGAPLGRAVAEIKDPYARHARGVFDDIRASSPLLREDLPVVKNSITGENVMMPQPLGGRWFRPFHPFTMAQPDPTPGEVLLERYGVKAPSFAVASGVPGPTGEFAEPAQGQADAIKLTDDQRNEFIDIYANMKADYGNIIGDNKPKTVSEALDAVENTKMFKDASVGGKTTILNTIVNGVYHGSYQVFLGSHPDIATQIQTNRGEKQISNAPPAQQDQLRQELDSSIKDYQLQLNNQMHEYQMMNLRKDSAQPGESIDSTKDAAAINDIYR